MMKLIALLAFSMLAAVASPRLAQAQYDTPTDAPAVGFADEDLDPVVRALSPHTYALTAPIYVYNWFNADGRSAVWSQQFDSDSYAGFAHLQSMGKTYWQSLCSKDASMNPPDCSVQLPAHGTDNMYGPGLYLAIDPVATQDYGNGSGWVLMQIHLPKGFRVLDLDAQDSFDVPQDALNALAAVGCQFRDARSGKELIDHLLVQNTENDGTGTCSLAVRKILKNRLHIDGFFYNYIATPFTSDCRKSPSQGRSSAMVLTNTSKLKQEDIRIFNAQSTDDREDRIRIQTLFYKNSSFNDYGMPTTMSATNAPRNSLSTSYDNSLLWPDLEGAALPSDQADWMQGNLYQCSPSAATAVVQRHRPGMVAAPAPTPTPAPF